MQLQKSSCHTFSNRLNRYTAFSAITLVVGLFLYGCGENRVVQCNKFVTVANKAKTLVAPKDSSGFTSLADSIEQVRTEVQAVAVQDVQLKEAQVQLLGMYGDVSQALKAQFAPWGSNLSDFSAESLVLRVRSTNRIIGVLNHRPSNTISPATTLTPASLTAADFVSI